jgi:acetoin utilization protein AcuC
LIEKTVISFNEKLRQYDLGEGHPFRGDRFVNAIRFFENQGLFMLPQVTIVQPQPATKEDLLRIHDPDYVNLIFNLAKENESYDIETPVSPTILEGALLISGSAILCGKTVLENAAKLAVSLGGGHHHAGRNYGGGFCLFNDIAVLVEYMRAKNGVERFLILDHDVHFGNGTSDIYYRDPTVLYISLHQDPRTLYPGTGFIWQTGQDKGEGYNVNVPLPPGTGDSTYIYALKEIFVPLAEEFKPQIIIANGGSDPHFADTLGNLALTVKGFFELARIVRNTADIVCDGKLVLMPGSGYNPEILPLCWYALVAGAAGLSQANIDEPSKPPVEPSHCRGTVEKTIDELKRLLRKKWACFSGFAMSGAQ